MFDVDDYHHGGHKSAPPLFPTSVFSQMDIHLNLEVLGNYTQSYKLNKTLLSTIEVFSIQMMDFQTQTRVLYILLFSMIQKIML